VTHVPVADGYALAVEAYCHGLMPDPELWVDEWAEEHMRIPTGAERGKYRVARTPFAREVMRVLSPAHPARRIVAMVASQLMKTQVGLNWLGALADQAPANGLVLLPTLPLAKRVSSRVDKTIQAVPRLREVFVPPRSRDARYTIDTKETRDGSAWYVTTAGSASNLAEIPCRYIYGDEIDRWDVDVDGEGDPIDLAEARTSTFGRHAKIYYTSTPTVEKASRIEALFLTSDQRHYFVPCPECGHWQTLEWEHVTTLDDGAVRYACAGCGALIPESAKVQMLERGEWRATADGDGETVGFHLSALYAPPGWVSWQALAKQYAKAKAALDAGDPEPMQVFWNTRLARTWNNTQEMTKPGELQARAEPYPLRQAPADVLVLTGAVDVQANRLELLLLGWGEGLERWVVDHHVLMGDPSDLATWSALEEYLLRPVAHASGRPMLPRAVCIDSGGHHTQEVYEFTRVRRRRGVLAVKGASKTGRPVIAQRPSKVDVTTRGTLQKWGAELWVVGTDTAKDWLMHRMKLTAGPGALHFSADLPEDFYAQLVAERKLTRYVKGFKRAEWVKAKADRNEALDLAVYNLAAAHYLGLHRYQPHDWSRLRAALNPPQADLFAAPTPTAEAPAPPRTDQPTAATPPPRAPRRAPLIR
jgi:phage terminase large subunit GpA-like protein